MKTHRCVPKILIVDDEPVIRSLYGEELEVIGYEVITRSGGYRLTETIESEKPDLVVLDIRLDEYDGLDLLQDIKRQFDDLPVILCSAYSSFREDLKSRAAAYYVEKSASLLELKLRIGMALDSDLLFRNTPSYKLISELHRLLVEAIDHQVYDRLIDSLPFTHDSLCAEVPSDALFIANQLEALGKHGSYNQDRLWKDNVSLFQNALREIRTARRKARKYSSTEAYDLTMSFREIDSLYDSYHWTVLSLSSFNKICDQVREDLAMEANWLQKKLADAIAKLEKGQLKGLPFEELKHLFLLEPSHDSSESELLDLILADVRHDLLGVARKIDLKCELSGYQLEQESQALLKLYERLADISGFKVKPSVRCFDLAKFIEEQLDHLGLNDKEALSVTFEHPEQELRVTTDQALLGVAIRQVLRNAVEAVGDQKGSINILLSARDDSLEVKIQDDGPGIAAEILPSVYEPRFSHGKKGAQGIGLSLTKLALLSIRGEISITISEGEGTTVTLTIPGGDQQCQ